MLRRVDRLVLQEFSAPLLFGVGMFSLLTITTVVLQDALKFVTKWNLPPIYVLKLVGLGSLNYVVLSIPMGVLLATLLSIGRLNSDHEITALRAAGLSLYRIVAPLLIAGSLLAALTFIGFERIVPICNQELKDLKNSILLNKTGKIKQERAIIQGQIGVTQWVLVADEIDGIHLKNVNLFIFDPVDMDKDISVRAEEVIWEGNDWTFYNMRTVRTQPSREGDDRVILVAKKGRVPNFNINPRALNLRSIAPEDMSAQQLFQVINDLEKDGDKSNSPVVRDFRTKLYFKYALPLTPLFFIFVAFPLAILPQRSSNAMGMGIALLIVLSYYVLSGIFQKLGASGILLPVLAAWLPNAVLLGTGVALMESRQRG